MSEKIKHEEADNRATIIKASQDPVFYLEKNFNKGAGEAIKFLGQVRNKIQNDSSYAIEGPDADFKQFYVTGNSSQEHYDALVRMLKRAGYDRAQVVAALVDYLPDGAVNSSRSKAVKEYIVLTETAVKEIYGESE